MALFTPTDNLLKINQRMNGPRMQWGRVPQLSLQLFIIFNKNDIFNQIEGGEQIGLWLPYTSLGFTFFSTSYMDSDQTVHRKIGTPGPLDVYKIFPLSFVTIVFRVFSFSLTISLFRYISIPLYFLLILISILLQRWQNPASNSFIMEGIKSIFTMGRLRSFRSLYCHKLWFWMDSVTYKICNYNFNLDY